MVLINNTHFNYGLNIQENLVLYFLNGMILGNKKHISDIKKKMEKFILNGLQNLLMLLHFHITNMLIGMNINQILCLLKKDSNFQQNLWKKDSDFQHKHISLIITYLSH